MTKKTTRKKKAKSKRKPQPFSPTNAAYEWRDKISTLFPSDEKLSAPVVGLLMRADEIRICHARIERNAREKKRAERTKRQPLWSAAVEDLMLFRFSIVAAFDLEVHVKQLNKDERFRATLATWSYPRDEFQGGMQMITKTIDRWRRLRNKLFAHLDYDAIEPVLARGESASGHMALGQTQGDFSFEAAHLPAMIAISEASGDEWRAGMKHALEAAGTAKAGAIRIVWPTLWAFDRITGRLIPPHLRMHPPKDPAGS